jgi:hypothetical protein
MAKKQSDSKVAVAGALALALAIAGVVLVKEPLQSSRPVGTGLEMKQTTGEQLVRARLWEDPLEAVQRGIRETEHSSTGQAEHTLDERLAQLRTAMKERVNSEQRITVLFVTTAGGPYVESTESRIRDRYAVSAALGVSCYVPERTDNLAYIEGEPHRAIPAIPYEWFTQHATRVCDDPGGQADKVVVIWLPDEALEAGFLTTLTSLSQALVCQETRVKGKTGCARISDSPKLMRFDPTLQQSVTFKIIGPRSSSAFRALLAEARRLYPEQQPTIAIWPNKSGMIELYSPWATAMKGLLAYGMVIEAGNGEEECRAYEKCEQEFRQRLARAGIRLAYDIGTNDVLFKELVDELERRQVRLGWDAVILIGEWDSFYGRALPIEFRAAACARIAQLSEAELKAIDVHADVRSSCQTIPQAINLQIQHPADYERLNLNVFRYSYLSGLDGEVPGEDNRKPGEGNKKVVRAAKAKSDNQQKEEQRDRPEGTSQVDYVRALVDRIRLEGQGARAIGIFGSDPYDSLLIMRALRPAFPHAIFFTVDLDARYLHPSEYKWTRNMVIASPFGLQLARDLQPNVPPFRSSYQTSAYFATLQAVGHVVCQRENPVGAASGPCATTYHASLTPDDQLYDAGSHPRLFEVGREGAVDLSVVKKEGIRTIHPLRTDLAKTDTHGQLKQGVMLTNVGVAALGAVGIVVVLVVAWTNQRLWSRISRYPRILSIATVLVAFFMVLMLASWTTFLLANHDEGEPFAWIVGVSVWPSELLRLTVVVLSVLLFIKGARDLAKNGEQIGKRFYFEEGSGRQPFSPGTVWTNLQRVYHPVATKAATTVWQAWARYREASQLSQGMARTALLFIVYLGAMGAIEKFVLDDELIHPCRGLLSCQIDWFMTLSSVGIVVVLNLAVFDAIMLCRRWIGWVTTSTGGWSDWVQDDYLEEYGLGIAQRGEFEKVRYVAVVDLIAQRTEVVNRLIRYPFIALLIMIAARNEYFDIWNYPTLLLLSWSVNVLLALLGAFLLYQSASQAKETMLAGLNRQMIQTLGIGTDQEIRAKQLQHIIGEVEANQKGAFVPLYQQPVVESSLYGFVALLQYLYLS